MEYAYGFIIYYVIHDFKRVSLLIETDKQVLILLITFIKPAVIFCGVKRLANIIFGYFVIKSGIIKLNDRIHVLIITNNKEMGNYNMMYV